MTRTSKALDFLPPLVAFGAALVAIAGSPTWNDQGAGIEKITSTGWVVIGISFAALIATLLVTLRNHGQQALRTQIARTGREELLRGLEQVVRIFKDSQYWDKDNPRPTSPLDLLRSERRSALASLNLNAMSPYADGKGNVKWWEMFEDTATKGSLQITTTLQIYVTFLDAVLIDKTTRLLNSEFMSRLHHTRHIINANTRGELDRPVHFFWVSPDNHMKSGYEEFWPLVAEVMRLCSGNEDDWRES
ncbi:hypothetical protein M2404_001074 [Rheinheimera pacifica]|uniref:hypothetical protein n=1 Tax=Rheinheimera pacifica TaxID=173990 RepID=UPI002168C7D0|nr:hypothetical protein [Rheinheimera pacifica]MCS4306751.1 hypothetical protein [Rheinheimera pacifica]